MSKKKRYRFKSRWEETVFNQIISLGQKTRYEGIILPFTVPETVHKYTPDFPINDTSVIIEAKGKFVAADRKKHLFIKEQYPKLKLYIVFMNANQRLSKKSRTTYGQWCDKHGIMWSHKEVKKEWFN